MKTLTCIALEDEAPAIELLRSYLSHFPGLRLKAHFTNAFEAREFLKNESVDVLFLDIQLPGISGMEFLKILDHRPLVVVTSAYDEHAIEAFGLEVFDYLLKPYSLVRFTKTVDRIERHFSPSPAAEDKTVTLKDGWEYRKIRLSELKYIESQREYLLFYLKNGDTIRTRMTMSEGMAFFLPQSILRIHRSFLVPVNHIKAVSATEVVLESKSLPIGRSYREKVLDYWTNRSIIE